MARLRKNSGEKINLSPLMINSKKRHFWHHYQKMWIGCTKAYCLFTFSFVSGSRCLPYHFKSPMGGNWKKYLKVNTRHGAWENGEILLVKEVVYRTFHREIRPLKAKSLLEGYVWHKVRRKLTGKWYIVRWHSVSLGVVAPLIEEAPWAPCEATCYGWW